VFGVGVLGDQVEQGGGSGIVAIGVGVPNFLESLPAKGSGADLDGLFLEHEIIEISFLEFDHSALGLKCGFLLDEGVLAPLLGTKVFHCGCSERVLKRLFGFLGRQLGVEVLVLKGDLRLVLGGKECELLSHGLELVLDLDFLLLDDFELCLHVKLHFVKLVVVVSLEFGALLGDVLLFDVVLFVDLSLELIDLVFDDHGLHLGFLSLGLTEVGLQVLEEGAGRDLDVSDLDGLEPHAPALHDLEHLLSDGVTDDFPVAEHLIDGGVSDA